MGKKEEPEIQDQFSGNAFFAYVRRPDSVERHVVTCLFSREKSAFVSFTSLMPQGWWHSSNYLYFVSQLQENLSDH